MTQTTPSLEEINAYVDGELDAQAASRVARAVSEDRELAHRVAVLTQLKALVRGTLEDDEETARPTLRPAGRSSAPRSLLAAAAMLLLFIGAGVVTHLASLPQPPAWYERGIALHLAWSGGSDTAPEPQEPALVSLAGLGAGFRIPDLSSAKLQLSMVRAVRHAGHAKGLHLGYRGTRGCRVSLLLFPADTALASALLAERRGAATAYRWRAGEVGHLLLAEGMDAARLRLIAESLHRATLEARPFDAETRTALARSRVESQPCMA